MIPHQTSGPDVLSKTESVAHTHISEVSPSLPTTVEGDVGSTSTRNQRARGRKLLAMSTENAGFESDMEGWEQVSAMFLATRLLRHTFS